MGSNSPGAGNGGPKGYRHVSGKRLCWCTARTRFFYDRGTAEHWIKEGKELAMMGRPSSHRFRLNDVPIWLIVIPQNLTDLWQRPVLPNRHDNWSLKSLQERLVETGGRLVNHARCNWLLLAESHLTRRVFGPMVRRIELLPLPVG
jgi:hypothetical protein